MPSQLSAFFAELKRRRVPRTAFWYVGGSVALVEAADIFLPSLGAPAGSTRLLAILAAFGLPVALTFAWVFDVSAAATASTRKTAWLRGLAIGSVFVLSAGGAYLVWARRAPDSNVELKEMAADPSHVAVMPFSTIGDDADVDAFASQLQARLIDGLSSATSIAASGPRRLRVVSRASILPFSTGTISVDSLRRALDVGMLLEGTVEKAAESVRVRIRLVDTETGDQIAHSTATARADDRLALLDAVADSVVLIIRKELGPVVRDRMRLAETTSRDAFDYVLLAGLRFEEFARAYSERDYARAERVLSDADSLFAAAEALDPKWIEPIVERGRLTGSRVRLAFAQAHTERIGAEIEAGIRHAERALALRPGDPRALVLRSTTRRLQLHMVRPADPAAVARIIQLAERDARNALIGNPIPAHALRLVSELAAERGNLVEALDYGERAYAEDPYLEQVESTIFRLFEYSFALGQDSVAAKWCADGRKRFTNAIFHDCRLSLAAWSSRYPLTPDSAWSLVAAQLHAYPQPLRPQLEPRLHAMVAAVLAHNRQRDSALIVLRSARARDAETPGMIRTAAGVYGVLGMPDSALAMIRRYLEKLPDHRSMLPHWAELRALARDPRFLQLTGGADAQRD